MSAEATSVTGKLRLSDLARVASVGVRTRRLRAALSALGIAIGVAAIVAVLGLSASSQAGLLAEIDRLGTNLLTVTNGQSFFGDTAELPLAAPAMIARIGPVQQVAETGSTSAAVYRSRLIPSVNTNGLSVQAASLELLPTVGASVAQGVYLNAATARLPVVVLGATAAERLGIGRIYPGVRVWLGGQWFYVAGILTPAELAPEIDTAAPVGFAAAKRYLGFHGHSERPRGTSACSSCPKPCSSHCSAVRSASRRARSPRRCTRRRSTGRSSCPRSRGPEASALRSRSARSPACCRPSVRHGSRRPR